MLGQVGVSWRHVSGLAGFCTAGDTVCNPTSDMRAGIGKALSAMHVKV